MYDTVGMFLENHSLKEDLLENPKDMVYPDTGEVRTFGNYKNLRVKLNGNNTSITGSLAKYYFGDNLQQLTRKDTERAIEKISDYLQLPVSEANIFRLDIGANFILDEPLYNYYTCLGNLSRFKKSLIANKPYFIQQQQRHLNFMISL